MSNFGGLILTNKGRALQAKVQAGATLHFNRIGIGDGNLGSTTISTLNALVSEKKSLAITKLKTQGSDKAIVGGVLSNSTIVSGFYFREIGVFAQDPTDGEILYCYANAGAGAEYIPAGGGPDIIEKNIDVITLTANATTVTATLASGIYAAAADVGDMSTVPTTSKIVAGAIAELFSMAGVPNGSITPAKLSFDPATQVELDVHISDAVKHITGAERTSWNAKETTAGAQAKADAVNSTLTSHLADYIRQPGYGTTAGAANTYTLALTPPLTSYVAGVAISVNINITNTGASTINVNALGAKAIVDSKGNAMTAGKLTAGRIYPLRYNGTAFQFQGEGSDGNAVAADLLIGKTADNINGPFVGTIPVIAADTASTAVSATAGRLYMQPPLNRYWNNTGYYTYFDDPDFIAANILNGINLFGLAGSAKRQANGTLTQSVSGNFTISGLSFRPNKVIISTKNTNQTSHDLMIISDAVDIYNMSVFDGTKASNMLAIKQNSTNLTQGSGSGTINTDGFTCTRNQGVSSLISWWAFE